MGRHESDDAAAGGTGPDSFADRRENARASEHAVTFPERVSSDHPAPAGAFSTCLGRLS